MPAFLLAIEILLGVAGIAVFRGALLPECLGFAMGGLFFAVFRAENRRWIVPFALAYFCSVVLAWSFPAPPISPGQWQAEAFQVALGIAAATGFALTAKQLKGTDSRPLAWLCPIFAMGVIIGFVSSSVGGASPMIAWFMNHGCTSDQAHLYTYLIRKSGHFSYYGTLGIAGTFAAQRIDFAAIKAAAIGLSVVFLTAGFDELRQSSQPGRTGSAYDVMLDMAGALVFITLALWTQRIKMRPPTR